MTDPMRIEELTTDAQLLAAFDVMRVLRPRLEDVLSFIEQVRIQEAEGYRLLGGFHDGTLVTLAGVRRSHTLSRGPHAFVDDLVTHPDHQQRGYATAMLRHIAAEAKAQGLPRVYLDARATALTYYEKLNFQKMTAVPCWIDADALLQA